MPEDSIYEHSNEALFAQVKRPFYQVVEHYNIPRPIKLTHGNNLKIAQDVLGGNIDVIDNNKILQLVYSARDNAAFTPIAYYLIYDKQKSLSNLQIKELVSLLSVDSLSFMLQKVGELNPVASTISDEAIDRIHVLVRNPSPDANELKDAFYNLPIDIQRMGLSFFPENIKQAFVGKLMEKGGRAALDTLSGKQKTIILSELLLPHQPYLPAEVSNTGEAKPMVMPQVAVALGKYSKEDREATLQSFPDNQINKSVQEFYSRQFNEIHPNIFMLFMDGTTDQLREYSKLIEEAKDRGEHTVPLNEEQKKFFESIVSVSVSTAAPYLITLHTGVQSSAVIPIPAEVNNDNMRVTGNDARMLVTYDGGIKDVGDKDNRILPDVKATTYHGAMHEICHSKKLRHFDSMFYAPEETARFEQLQKLPLVGMAKGQQPSLNPSGVSMEGVNSQVKFNGRG